MDRRARLVVAALVAVASVAAIAVLAWPRAGGPEAYDALRPGPPQAVALTGTTLSWQPPVDSPAPLMSYSVLYRAADAPTDPWSVYARESLAVTIDLAASTASGCAVANPQWTCALTGGDLVAGRAYDVRVLARTAEALGYMSADVALTAR
jgi:hypothetical protein